MSILHPFLAQDIIPTDVLPGGSWRWMGLTLKELVMVLGAVAGVTLLVVLWAVYLRKRPHRHSHRHHRHRNHQDLSSSRDESSPAEAEPDSEDNNGDRRYRRKRRRRREHRPRNPTLAETGGLPPLRSERPSDPLP
jgi:FtsZ-interacting cell division protein ZipA